MDFLTAIDKSWTLFLDRDGVINHEKNEDYIRNRDEFKFYENAPEAVAIFNQFFGTIIIVTNQRGIGKGLMTDEDLADIHTHMNEVIKKAGGKIDEVYYCSSMDNDCFERKPNPGMAHLARKDFPAIDLSKSIIIGNKLSDMEFGRNAGMHTVFVATTHPQTPFPHPFIDCRFGNLYEMALYLHQLRES